MKRLLVILLFPIFAFTQTKPDTCFTQQEIVDISYTLDSLFALDSINTALIDKYVTLSKQQDELIKLGTITENDRVSFPKNKFCAFSSASYLLYSASAF
jgi:hypothetical protein